MVLKIMVNSTFETTFFNLKIEFQTLELDFFLTLISEMKKKKNFTREVVAIDLLELIAEAKIFLKVFSL